jgi:predicted CoA-binding protein
MDVEKLDELASNVLALKHQHDLAKTEASRIWAKLSEKEAKLMAAIEEAGKEAWELDGYRLSRTEKYRYASPKTVEEKQAYATYVKEKYGEDIFWAQYGVNNNTLNSFLKKEQELAADEGYVFDSPIGEPIAHTKLSIRAKR